MTQLKNLFAFSTNQVDTAFKHVRVVGKIHGLKLLSVSVDQLCEDQFDHSHGKLLIITPRKSGKAHDRNLLRRRLKAIFYEEKLFERKQVSIILAYSQAHERSFQELKDFLVAMIPS